MFDILWMLAQARLDREDLVQGRALVREVAAGASGDLKRNAEMMLRRLDRLGQPLKLKFISVDGQDFDVQKLEGKVVLVDFWATSFGPCVTALSEIKSLYKKYHDQGFEIIGISFDKDKSKLLKFLAEHDIQWIQYCDGRGWDNRFGREFEVTAIPTLWLLDRKGVLRELNAQVDLERKVRGAAGGEAVEPRPLICCGRRSMPALKLADMESHWHSLLLAMRLPAGDWTVWKCVGWLGNAVFFTRFFVQWLHRTAAAGGRAHGVLVAESGGFAPVVCVRPARRRLGLHFCLRLHLDSLHEKPGYPSSPQGGTPNLHFV